MLKNRKFILSFAITSIIIFSLFGVLKADYESRLALTGDSSPGFTRESRGTKTYLLVNALGIKGEYDISTVDKIGDALLDFICIPHE